MAQVAGVVRVAVGTRVLVGALMAVAALGGCAHQQTAPAKQGPAPPTAAELPPPDSIPGTFSLRQKLTATSAKGGGSFEAVLQKQPGTLTLVGLTPYGSRAFLLQQTKGDVSFTKYVPRDLPFAPTFLLLDIHRVLATWIGPPLVTGERSGQAGDETIHERWQDGKLVERTFTNAESTTAGHDHDHVCGLRCVEHRERRDAHYTPECTPGLPGRHRDGAIPVTSCCKFVAPCLSRFRSPPTLQ